MMAVSFAPGDIVHIEHAVRPNSNVLHDVLWPPNERESTQVWKNGERVTTHDFRHIEATEDAITLVTYSQRVTARPSGESQPGMVVGEVTATGPSTLVPTP